MSYAIVNGETVDAEAAVIPATDRGLLLGDGLFETMRAYGGRVFGMADHLDRLSASCDFLALSLPWSMAELAKMVDSLLEKNQLESARVRLTVTRGEHRGAMDLAPAASPTLLITAEPIPESMEDTAVASISLAGAGVRFSENNPTFRHKTLNRLPHLVARTQAMKAGADEAMILDERGNLACASTGNLFAFHQDQLFTPPLTGPILPGVTRRVVLELAKEDGLKIRENFFSPIMLAGADEVFMTNSVQEVVAVVGIDSRPVGSGRSGPVAARLKRSYRGKAERGQGHGT